MTIGYLLSISTLILVGCGGPRYQAQRFNAPLHSRPGEVELVAYTGVNANDGAKAGLDGSFAITDHIAVKAGSMVYGFENDSYSRSLLYEFGIGGYTNDKDTILSLAGWILYGNRTLLSGYSELGTSKYGLQTEIGMRGDVTECLLGLRYMWVQLPATYYTEANLANYLEPTFVIRAGPDYFKFETTFTLVFRVDESSNAAPGWVTLGLFSRIN